MSDARFLIHGPALIPFSGGRTSGHMLCRILDAGLQPDVHAALADTGQEREETDELARGCEQRWRAPIKRLNREDRP